MCSLCCSGCGRTNCLLRWKNVHSIVEREQIRAVQNWPWAQSWKDLQRFLGFANSYRCFIRRFSGIAAPLSQLTSTSLPFVWSEEPAAAFQSLKTSAPILHNPDVTRQFVVEVDASDSSVGAVPAVSWGPTSPPVCVLLQTPNPCRTQLRRRQPWPPGSEVGPGRVYTSLRGCRPPICGVDGPPQIRVHPHSQAPHPLPG